MAKNLRVCLADCTATFGGAFEQAKRLANALVEEQEIKVCLLSRQEQQSAYQDLSPQVEQGKYPLIMYAGQREKKPQNQIARFGSIVLDVSSSFVPEVVSFYRALRRLKPDILHLNNLLNAQFPAAVASRLAGIPCISTHQDFEYRSRLVQMVEPAVRHHIAISQSIEQDLIEFGVAREKISVIYDCVDTEQFSPARGKADLQKRFGISPDRLVFALFGRLVPWKGHEYFLQMAQIVLEKIPQAHALIVGDVSDGDADYEQQLRKRAQQLGIAPQVTFAGYQADVCELLNAVDVALHLSTRAEPFGLVVVEAMACQKPVVAMAEGGPTEIVVDGVTGFLVPPKRPAAIADVLIRLLENKELRLQFGEAARKRAVAEFSASTCAKQHASLYHQIMLRNNAQASWCRRRG